MIDAINVTAIVITAIVNVAVTLAVVKVELRWLRRDVDRAQDAAEHAHRRIDAMQSHPR